MVAIAQHSLRAFVTGEDYGDFRILEAEVIRNQYAYPYVQARLTIARPTDQLMQVLDPRRSVRISLIAEKLYSAVRGNDQPAPADQYKSFRLWLVDREVDYDGDRITLQLSGAELLVEDYRLMSTVPVIFGPQSLRSVVNQVLSKIGRSLASAPADGAQLTEVVEWSPGESAWDFLTPLLEATGRRLWADETDNFRLTPRVTEPGGAVTLTLGESPIVSAVEALARTTDYYDAVHIKYSWTEVTGEEETDYVRYDVAQAYPTVRRVESIEYDDTRYPGPGAARERLKRALTRGRKVDLSFVLDITVNPGDSATILLSPDELSAGYVTATRWSYPANEMSIDTRDLVLVPAFAWINTPVGLAWDEAPTGTSWTNASTLFETEA